jgi:hypothetical protein
MKKLKSDIYLNQFFKSLDFNDWLKYFSCSVWEQLRSNYINSSIKISEIRITERLIEEIYELFINDIPLPLRLFHSKKESTNGNDIEIVIPISNNRYILFPCQAKKIYFPSESYKVISHTPKKTGIVQITTLLDYAENRVRGIPLYLFYNFVNKKFDTKRFEKEFYGCTLMGANTLYEKFYDLNKNKLQKPKFYDILDDVNPLIILEHFLGGNFSTKLIEDIFGKFNTRIKSYSEAELIKVGIWDEWLPSVEEESGGRNVAVTEIRNILSEKTNIIQYPFNPKYRIMITPYTITNRQNF